jgi:DnaJ-domain-containing protein 1
VGLEKAVPGCLTRGLREDVVVGHDAGTSGGSSTEMLRLRGASFANYVSLHNGEFRAWTMRLLHALGSLLRAAQRHVRGDVAGRREFLALARRDRTCRRSPMLRQVAEGVLIHQSELLQNNAVVVQGRAGVLLIDPGITGDEMVAIADDLRELGQPVVAGFSTHPDWDHVLWHAKLGEAPRYGTARCAASMRDLLSDAGWKARVAEGLPPEFADQIPLDLFGLITGLPAGTARIAWIAPAPRPKKMTQSPHCHGKGRQQIDQANRSHLTSRQEGQS